MTQSQESDIKILSSINDTLKTNPCATQRDFAKNSSLSLGMVNALLKRFAEKGWIMTKRLSPKKVCYLLTNEGLHCVASRTVHYMKRTFSVMNEYRNIIEEKIQNLKTSGFTRVILIGRSDIQFLIEYECQSAGLKFSEVPAEKFDPGKATKSDFLIVGEDELDSAGLADGCGIGVVEFIGE